MTPDLTILQSDCRRLQAENTSLRQSLALLREEKDAARKVADAAADWADAQTAYDAGAGGSSAYLRVRERLLRATVREYRDHLEKEAINGGES